jgi:hypothetical protein
VNVRVTLQRKLIAKRTGTNVAFVGFNTEVNLFVVLEMSCLGEGRVTPLALVGFLAGSWRMRLQDQEELEVDLPGVYSPMIP